MKVLIYNWAPFDDKSEGGGVGRYLRDSIPYLIKTYGWDITFLSSGHAYNPIKRKCYWEKTENELSSLGVQSYRIVNSPIKAPAHDSLAIISESIDNKLISEIFCGFIRDTGEYDAVIFHNVEGISTVTLKNVKEKIGCKIYLFAHNYHVVCPQIELLKDFKSPCHDYLGGKACIGCFGYISDTRDQKIQRAAKWVKTKVPGGESRFGDAAWEFSKQLFSGLKSSIAILKAKNNPKKASWKDSKNHHDGTIKSLDKLSHQFWRWRNVNSGYINNYVDAVIAVSSQVKTQLSKRGISPDLIHVAHLGFSEWVDIVERKRRFLQKKTDVGSLRVAFMGYPIPSKGLPFLIDSLQDADEWSKTIELSIYARYDDHLHRKVERIKDKVKSIHWIDGYLSHELDEISNNIDLLIVPSIWWETFHIVSYEMIMRGVPVIISDSVGFTELLRDKSFIFSSGNKQSLLIALENIINDPIKLSEFWDQIDTIPSQRDHHETLISIVGNVTH